MRTHTPQSGVPSAAAVLTVVAVLAVPALAQPFAFQRFAITSGGAVEAPAGELTMSLSLGLPIVGSASGGGFEMNFGFWGLEGEAAPRAPQIDSWASVRLHAGVPLAIVLDPAGPAVSESRQAPGRISSSGIFEIAVRFDQPVRPVDGQLDANDVSVRDQSGKTYTPSGMSLDDGGRLLRIAFASGALPDRRRYTLDVSGRFESLSGRPVEGDADCEVRGLVADVDSSGRVDLLDVFAVIDRLGQAADPTTARYDIDTDGTITLVDLALVLIRFYRAVE